MKTKVYQKPTTKVVKLQHHGMLMTSVEVQAQRNSYEAVENTWE